MGNYGVFEIRNIVTGQVYIGYSSHVNSIWPLRLFSLRNNKLKNKRLQFSFNKYGENAFCFYILEYCDEKKCKENKQKWIDFFQSNNKEYGFNMEIDAVTCRKNKEWKDCASKRQKGKKKPEEFRIKISSILKDRKRPREVKEKISSSSRKYKHLIKELKHHRNSGLSYCEIGKKYNIGRTTVQRYLNKFYPENKEVTINA